MASWGSYYAIGKLAGRKGYLNEWRKACARDAKVTVNGLGMRCIKMEIPTTIGTKRVLVALPDSEVGSWSDIKKGITKASKAAKQTLAKANKILNSKEAEQIAALTATVVPGADAGFRLAKGLSKTIDQASRGSAAAKGKIRQIVDKARAGNTNAQKLVTLSQAMLVARQQEQLKRGGNLLNAAYSGNEKAKNDILTLGVLAANGNEWAQRTLSLLQKKHLVNKVKRGGYYKSGLSVGGWLFNRGYRSPLQAAGDDPGFISRSLYLQGLNAKIPRVSLVKLWH